MSSDQDEVDDEWDRDTDEINSLASEDLYDSRPNRWTGPESTWRALTDADRQTFTALRAVENADLSVHLYNAFALRKPGLRRASIYGSKNINKETGENVTETDWTPGKGWTAWPVREDLLPDEGFMEGLGGRGEGDDDDDESTFRCARKVMPSTGLEEELSATMLRAAKERFLRRSRNPEPTDGGDDAIPPTPGRVQSSPSRSDAETSSPGDAVLNREEAEARSSREASGNTLHEQTEDGQRQQKQRRRADSPPLLPAVSADDESSYALLRPAARGIIGNLNRTLTILHNARVACVNHPSESSDSEAEPAAKSDTPASDRRPRMRGRSGSERYRLQQGQILPERKNKPGAGRPRKIHVPTDGETEYDMQVRVARQSKKRIPKTSEDGRKKSTEEERGPAGTSRRRKRSRRSRSSAVSDVSDGTYLSDDDAAGRDRRRLKRAALLGLRDWKDVIGAAAMAGFSAATIARATQRCADIFREGMDIRTLVEGPAHPSMEGGDTGESRATTVHYAPRNHASRFTNEAEFEDEDDESAAMTEVDHTRTVSRQSSIRLQESSSMGNSDAEESKLLDERQLKADKRRKEWFCPHRRCSRAIQSFGRRANLSRHLRLVHGENAESSTESKGGIESADEMDGAIHVDGFLKPIKARKGWRAANRGFRGRRKQEVWASEEDEGERTPQVEMGSEAAETAYAYSSDVGFVKAEGGEDSF